ncbi:fructose-6-phosphate aldolase [Candidatus Peregrinibacteria bacterium]|nr:fructose-6-phosphate aldolase [Candidatus Peregrinibacteria bacterium]
MQFYLDTANLEEIKKYNALGIVDGVTTNPSLIAKEGISLEERIKEICSVVKGPVSSEVVSTDYEGMLSEGRKFARWAENVYVKLPMTPDGIRACKTLSDEGINVNVTLIFSVAQALLAAKAGAALISPFVGRLDDIAEDGMGLIADIVAMLANYDYKAKVLVASIRHPRHVTDAAMMGADIGTMPGAVLDKLFQHPLTDKGLAAFLADWEKVKGIQK